MEDKPMTWGEASQFTWGELEYFKWSELALGKLELLKKKYNDNEPLPPQVYEKLKGLCDSKNKLPPDITRIISKDKITIGDLEYILNMAKQLVTCTPAIIELVSAVNDTLLKIAGG